MAITPLWRTGGELQHINETNEYGALGSAGAFSVSSTKFKTGGFSFATGTTSRPIGRAFTSTTQIRAGVFLNHNSTGGASTNRPVLCMVDVGTASLIQWAGDTSLIEMIINGSTVASVSLATAGIATVNTWYHIGWTYKAHASTGFFSLYVDGVLKLTYSGNTGSGIVGTYFGGRNNTSGWTGSAYFDDFYVDDTVGEADAAPPAIELPWLPISGAGSNTGWSVYGVGSNYQAVDDSGAPNDLTDFAFGTSSGLNDSYAVTNTTAGVTVPSGRSIAAVIPCAWAQRTDAASASTLKLGTLLSGTTVLGSAQTLPVGSFGMIQERQATKPGGGSWLTSDVDSMEYVQETAGSF
jgi:hypothetical protein